MSPILEYPERALRSVMDPTVNPLRHLHVVQRFQVMCVLGMMWTTIFCLGAGAWLYYGELIVFHVLVAFGVFVTGFTFRSATPQTKTYRDYPHKDRTARYDDVWRAS